MYEMDGRKQASMVADVIHSPTVKKNRTPWTRLRPRSKPNSLIQKLLDRFDPPKLRNT